MTITETIAPTRAACLLHGTWECGMCGWRRIYANRLYAGIQTCASCDSQVGTMLPMVHRKLWITNACAHDVVSAANKQIANEPSEDKAVA